MSIYNKKDIYKASYATYCHKVQNVPTSNNDFALMQQGNWGWPIITPLCTAEIATLECIRLVHNDEFFSVPDSFTGDIIIKCFVDGVLGGTYEFDEKDATINTISGVLDNLTQPTNWWYASMGKGETVEKGSVIEWTVNLGSTNLNTNNKIELNSTWKMNLINK